jgi:hypothetical protein
MDLYDIFQNFRIKDMGKSATDAKFKSAKNEIDIRTLQDQVDHLSLVTFAMCELLENIGFNKNMLQQKIQEIDLRDGSLDGRLLKKYTCTKCKRDIAGRHVKCLYCGEAVDQTS